MACRVYFCPETHHLPGRHKAVLRCVFDHWHPFGLLATGRQLVAALEDRLGRRLDPGALSGEPVRTAALAELLRIKLDWPYRRDGSHLCHFLFEDGTVVRPPVDDMDDKTASDPYGVIFRELESVFDAPGRQDAVRTAVDRRLETAVRELRG
jgi:hypothetical protein